MIKQILLNNQNISYTFKISVRARRLRIVIHVGGELVVTVPNWMPEKYMQQFLIQKSNWILEKVEQMKKVNKRELIKHTKKEIEEYKKKAKILAETKLKKFNTIYNFTYNNISIKNQKTMWGSCSRKKNLNFNYKIALLPEALSDYIIVHELCHLGEFNHSQKFWNLVARTIPNYMNLRRELKKQSMRLQ